MARKTISLRLDPEMIERLDEMASERSVKRTDVIEDALRAYLQPPRATTMAFPSRRPWRPQEGSE